MRSGLSISKTFKMKVNMGQAVEVKVRISNPEQKYTKKELCYEAISMSKDDAQLLKIVEGAIKDFKGPVEDVNVTLNMVW